MIDIIRHESFFNPMVLKEPIHVIGLGAVGSHVVEQLVRLGAENLHLWDFDTVGSHNISNQVYNENDIGNFKIDALSVTVQRINSETKIVKHGKYTDELLRGYVFNCVDSIKTRLKFYQTNEINPNLKAVFDTRIGLDDGQVYAANWKDPQHIRDIIEASSFKEEESFVPVSACGSKLTVLPTVIAAATYAITNFINFVKTGELARVIIFNPFSFNARQYK